MAHTTQPQIDCEKPLLVNLEIEVQNTFVVTVPNPCGAFFHSPAMRRIRKFLCYVRIKTIPSICNKNIPTVSERYYRRLNAKEEV